MALNKILICICAIGITMGFASWPDPIGAAVGGFDVCMLICQMNELQQRRRRLAPSNGER